MVDVPEEYRNIACVPKQSPFGNFIRRFESKNTRSKIQELIDDGVDFASMSKFDFFCNYVINPTYTIHDFVDVSHSSLRGYIFEALWDLCFKCNVVASFHGEHIEHLSGKIEDIRMIKRQLEKEYISAIANAANTPTKADLRQELTNRIDAAFKDQWGKLRVVRNTLDYLKSNKVFSGSSAGISDISFRYRQYKDDNDFLACKKNDKRNWSGHYVFVSSKYYTNEKSIVSYDVESIVQATRGLNIKYRVVLVVKDKDSLAMRIRRSHKKHVISSIDTILDLNDLNNALHRLRRRHAIHENIERILRSSKQPIDHAFASHMLCNGSHHHIKARERVVWQCRYEDAIGGVLLLMQTVMCKKRVVFHCSSKTEALLRSIFYNRYGFRGAELYYNKTPPDTVALHITFDGELSSSLIENTRQLSPKLTIDCFYTHTPPHGQQMIQFGVTQFMQLKMNEALSGFSSTLESNVRSIYTDAEMQEYCNSYPGLIALDTDHAHDAKSYSRYKWLLDGKSDVGVLIKASDMAATLLAYIFGTPSDIHEKYLVKNRVMSSDTPMSICLFVPSDPIISLNLKRVVAKERLYSSRVIVCTNARIVAAEEKRSIANGKHFIFVTSQVDKLPQCAKVAIFANNLLQPQHAQFVISTLYTQFKTNLYVLDLTRDKITHKVFF